MQLPFSFILAWRLLRAPAADRSVSIMTKLCFAGIFISTAALALIAAIMHGFEFMTEQTLQGMSPDLVIRAQHNFLNYPAIQKILVKDYASSIAASSGCTLHRALIGHRRSGEEMAHLVTLIGVDTTCADKVIRLPWSRDCTEHQHSLAGLPAQGIIIGRQLAQQLGVTCGDKLVIRYAPDTDQGTSTIALESCTLTIAGLFESGLEEWDLNGALISSSCAERLFPDNCLISEIHLKLAPGAEQKSVKKQLSARLKMAVSSWQDLNPALVSAVNLEHYAMLCILALIVLITWITTMALLCMHLMHQQKTIALLYANGMSLPAIGSTFVLMVVLIALSATILGLLVAAMVSYCLETYRLISLPNVYYSSYLPAHMSWTIAGAVLSISLLISLVATWYPIARLRSQSLIKLLRGE